MKIIPQAKNPQYNLGNNTPNLKPSLNLQNQPTKDYISFQGNFKFSDVTSIPCAYCGIKMITPSQRRAFLGALGYKKGKQLQKDLSEILEKMPQCIERDVALDIINESKKSPQKNIQALLQDITPAALERLQTAERAIFKASRKPAIGLTSEGKAKKEAYLKEVTDSLKDNTFQRKLAIKKLRGLQEAETNPNDKRIWGEMTTIVEQLPTSGNNKDAFIVKHHIRSADEIGQRLLEPYSASEEHIHPFSKDGISDEINYLSTHAKCNGHRDDTPFNEFLEQHPHIGSFIESNLRAIEDFVLQGPPAPSRKPPAYSQKPEELLSQGEHYLQGVSKTLFRESKGKIRLPWLRPEDAKPPKKHGH